jgi:hypothetical protein
MYEGAYWTLVNRKNGFKKSVIGNPYFSSNGKQILVTNIDLWAGYQKNGLELFAVDGDTLRKGCVIEIMNWGPTKAKWISENEIILRIEDINYVKSFMKMSFIEPSLSIAENSVEGISIGSPVSKIASNLKAGYEMKNEEITLEGDKWVIYNVYDHDDKIFGIEPDAEKAQIVWRIWVHSPRVRTIKGIGVGSTLGEIKSVYSIEHISTEGEGAISVMVKGEKFAFILDNSKLSKAWWKTRDTRNIPDSVTVSQIII